MNRLREGEICPIHRNVWCCGRRKQTKNFEKKSRNWVLIAPGTKQYLDGRIVKSPAARKRRKDFLLKKGTPCAACGKEFTEYSQVELAHRESKGFGGFKCDDSDANTTLLHRGANRAQGSMPLDVYLKDHWKPEHCSSI